MSAIHGILIIPSLLVIGFIFSTHFVFTRYHVSRSEGYSLYFYATYFGVLYVLFIIVIFSIGNNYLHLYSILYCHTLNVFPRLGFRDFEISVILLLSLITAHPFALLINFLVPGFIRRLILLQAIRRNDFERMLFKAVDEELLIAISLKSGKEYVGRIIMSIQPSSENREITILPILSGYRDKDTKKVSYNTDYIEIYSIILQESAIEMSVANIDDKSDRNKAFNEYYKLQEKIIEEQNYDVSNLYIEYFYVVIPVNQIITTKFYDESAYRLFNYKNKPNKNYNFPYSPSKR